jgi:MFS family permease
LIRSETKPFFIPIFTAQKKIKMNIKGFFKKHYIHITAIGIFLLLCMILFKLQLTGHTLRQADIESYSGFAHEASEYKNETGEQAMWTNSIFGGMPTTQISLTQPYNLFSFIYGQYLQLIPQPIGAFLWLLIGAYVGLCLMKINKWVAIFGSICLALMSYNFMIYTAGHNTKLAAFAFMLPLIGAFWYTYRTNWKLGAIYSMIFMSFEIAMNHLQMTYYLGFLLFALGVSEFIRSIVSKQFKRFSISTVSLLAAFGLAILVNGSLLFSTSDYLKYTMRGGNDLNKTPAGLSNEANTTSGLEIDYITQYSNVPDETLSLFSPYAKGVGDVSLPANMSKFEDLTTEYSENVQNSGIYWGENPMVYLGILLILLSFLAFIYVKDISRWFFLAIAVLCTTLSWGKFNLDFVAWFIENVPLYNKFRATTVIMMIVQIIAVILASFSAHALIKRQDELKENFTKFIISLGSILVLLLIILYGSPNKLFSEREKSNFSPNKVEVSNNVRAQVMQLSPEKLVEFQLNINDPVAVNNFVETQTENQLQQQKERSKELFEFRKEVVSSSNLRTVLLLLLGIGALILFALKLTPNSVSLGFFGVIAVIDLFSVSTNYLNDSEDISGPKHSRALSEEYRFFKTWAHRTYPMTPNSADLQIFAMEINQNAELKSKVTAAYKKGERIASEISEDAFDVEPIAYAHAFSALNKNTNYRVFDLTESPFNSANAAYFHKSLGGYHGAKLRNIQNLIEFHLNRTNNKVIDMMNVKYIIQNGDSSIIAKPNLTACGNAWFVNKIRTVNTPYDEINGLGSKFLLKNSNNGQFLVKEAFVFGAEKLQYYLPGKDTITVALSNGIPLGVSVTFAMDQNGKTELMMTEGLKGDSLRSFQSLVEIEVVSQFEPKDEAIMLKSEFSKGKLKTGKGTVKMTSYSPNKITYSADVQQEGLAVFSEVYYPIGWTAKVNGKETSIYKVNYLLRGLNLPKGKYNVELLYADQSFLSWQKISLITSICAALIIGLGIYFLTRKPKDLIHQD